MGPGSARDQGAGSAPCGCPSQAVRRADGASFVNLSSRTCAAGSTGCRWPSSGNRLFQVIGEWNGGVR